MSQLNRREFLNLFTASALSTLVPKNIMGRHAIPDVLNRPEIDQLPEFVREIIHLTPKTVIGKDGYLSIVNENNGKQEIVPQRRTNWNLQNTQPYQTLKTDKPWGIVLHWFGDKYPQQQDLDFYLRGFNGKRYFDGILVMTSAHFLVGDLPVTSSPTSKELGIVQTQKPDPDGIPYQASHISPLDYKAYHEGENYFLSALNKISVENPGVHFLLQDFYNQPAILAHMHTIAIEISGHSFEDPNFYPCMQKIANVLSLVWSIMKRYSIPAKDIMGHFELQLSKPDPGKKFLALIKYLIGIKALFDADDDMNGLVFGPFESVEHEMDPVTLYFRLIRDYLLMTAYPKQIHEWDAWSKYWFMYDMIRGIKSAQFLVDQYYYPLQEPFWFPGNRYLEPENHEGVDFYPDLEKITHHSPTQNVYLLANGICIYVGQSSGGHDGQLAIFKHRQKDGSEIISFYSHLERIMDVKVGEKYPAGSIIGNITTSRVPPYDYLHFSLAYGPSWEIHLQKEPNPPLNAGPVWIRIYFIDPIEFLVKTTAVIYDPLRNTRIQPR